MSSEDPNATGSEPPDRKITPVPVPVHPLAGLPQKRPFADDDHIPQVSSPLNPSLNPETKPDDPRPADDLPAMPRDPKDAKDSKDTKDAKDARESKAPRNKKDSAKKRESKAGAASSAAAAAAAAADSARATPDPRAAPTDISTSEDSPLRYKLAPPKLSDFEPARGPAFTHHHTVPGLDGGDLDFYETSEHVSNKRSYHYMHCIADPAFPSSFYYRNTEPAPYGAHISFEDAAAHMYFDQQGRHITTDKGFRMARANVAVREGRWYWECRITRGTLRNDDGKLESHGHVRVGFARREASMDAPVGFDAYSYGIRDVEGQKVHMSRPKDFLPAGEEIREGDVIGLEIQLPSEQLHRKVVQGQFNPAVDLLDDDEPTLAAANIVRDRIPIRFKAHIYFEKIDYHPTKELEDLMHPSATGASGNANGTGSRAVEAPNPNHATPALRTLPNSCIRVYKNGVLMGTPFSNLLAFLPPASRPQVQVGAREGKDDGMLGYYPAISVFRGGAAEVNFGPDFWCPPQGISASLQPPSQGEDVDMEGSTGAAGGSGQGTELVNTGSDMPLRPLAERYDEQIAEDVVADVVDEVDFWIQDGARVIDRTGGRDEKAEPVVGIAPAREEIKELVQDD